MDEEFVLKHYGKTIDLGECLLGENLNLLTLRGFAALDHLALISDSDVFDQQLNPKGTQRDISKQHARECLKYALADGPEFHSDPPRFLPEILLNARDTDVVEVYDPADPSVLIDFNSAMDRESIPNRIVGVRVHVNHLSWPKPNRSPKISRVDGNHRLFGVDELLDKLAEDSEDQTDDYPIVSFALMIGVNQFDESRLFRDINGEHKGMEVAHLDSLEIRFSDKTELKADTKRRPLWLAYELAQPGRAFDGMVFMGGAKKGLKESDSGVPPVRINSLKTTLGTMIHYAPNVSERLSGEPELLLEMINNYWDAVRETFPDAWQDRRDHILLQAIGLGAFARFGGQMLERAYADESGAKKDFMHILEPVASTVSLKREDYPGIAGAGGQAFIAKRLMDACGDTQVQNAKLRAKLLPAEPSVSEKLAAAKAKQAKQAKQAK